MSEKIKVLNVKNKKKVNLIVQLIFLFGIVAGVTAIVFIASQGDGYTPHNDKITISIILAIMAVWICGFILYAFSRILSNLEKSNIVLCKINDNTKFNPTFSTEEKKKYIYLKIESLRQWADRGTITESDFETRIKKMYYLDLITLEELKFILDDRIEKNN